MTPPNPSSQPDEGKPDPSADWWTTTDVARFLNVTIDAVSHYRRKGMMPIEEIKIGRTRAWRPATIIEWNRKRPGRGWRKGKSDHESSSND